MGSMNIALGHNPQVTFAPRCPKCNSADSATCRSKGITLEHMGKKCRAQQQYRKCRACGENFPAIHIKGEVETTRRRKSSGVFQ
jgi:hypothetical protein